jgi:hypothetical protein
MLFRSAVGGFAADWKALHLPLTSATAQAEPPFPIVTTIPGSAEDELPSAAALVLYRVLAAGDTPTGNSLRVAKMVAATALVY